MQKYDQELQAFVEGKLSTKHDEIQVNEACIKFVKNTSYKNLDHACDCGSYLVCLIYDWGFYPNQLISYLTQFKAKVRYEESTNKESSEQLAEVLIKLIQEDYSNRQNSLYFKLIGLLKFQNLKSKKLLDNLVQVCLTNLGQYVLTDKLVYIILIKLSLKISDDIKEFKVVIAEKIFSLVFMIFTKL